MNRHTEFVRFDCAGGIAPARKPGWNAMPLIRAVAIVATILTILSFL